MKLRLLSIAAQIFIAGLQCAVAGAGFASQEALPEKALSRIESLKDFKYALAEAMGGSRWK